MSMDLEYLIRTQDEIQLRIANAMDNLSKIGKENITAAAIDTRLQQLEGRWAKFEKQHEYLCSKFWETLKTHDYITGDFAGLTEETYLVQKTRLINARRALPSQSTGGNASASSESSSMRQRTTLPRIQLPQFSGKYADWPPFRDLFQSVIGTDAGISDVEKLHYLKASLKGEAETLIRNLTTISENYQRAWKLLLEHYENKRLLVRSYFTTFTSLPKMKGESAGELKRVLQCTVSTVSALESIERPISNCEDLFVHMVVELLDPRSRRDWEDCIGGTSEPASYAELKAFLEKRLQTLDALHPQKAEATSSKPGDSGTRSARSHHAQKQEAKRGRCSLCRKDHFLMLCDGYQEKSAEDRKKHVEANQLCLNCLGKHQVSECQSKKNCSVCRGRHHSSLHDACRETSATSHIAHQPRLGRGTVILATARVRVADKFGALHSARALIDQGSEASMISEALTQRLRLPRSSASVTVFGVGGTQTGTANGRVSIRVLPRVAGSPMTISALILPRLSAYTGVSTLRREPWKHLHGLELADPDFTATDPVDILLGADVYAAILDAGVIKGGPREPIAQRTSLGWILSGAFDDNADAVAAHSHSCVVDGTLTELVKRLWEQEEVPRGPPPMTEEERECEDLFATTHSRDENGRYVVRLPLTDNVTDFAGTRSAATRLLSCMEGRFARDPQLQKLYREFMDEYEELDHMSTIDSHDATGDGRVCYLPHHGVLKCVDGNTKLRVVFNGSSSPPSGISLNDKLRVGQNLLPALPDVLTRWRRHAYAIASDIEKMYRQILVHPADRDLQRILWRRDKTVPVKEYRLNTVTYGLACAPFLAIRSIHQLATDEEERYPKGAAVLRRDVYVDDILTGAASLPDAQEIQRQLSHLCKAGGFPLKKWSASHPELLRDVPATDHLRADLRAWEPHESHSMLGLQWHPSVDQFSYAMRRLEPHPTTKRTVLSVTAQLFDPLGWITPVVIRAKILIQSVWLQGLDWDTPLTPTDATFWATFKEDLPHLKGIRVPRWIEHQPEDVVELHGFADASERAFAAVLYIRAVGRDGTARVSLVAAKSKVAPVKQVSLPRLELCAAALLASLVNHYRAVIEIPIKSIHLWSDSTVTLSWIRGHPSRWKTYVANRVAEIQRNTPEASWHHTPGGDNPADCASRGLMPSELVHHELWWKGPPWLTTTPGPWHAATALDSGIEIPEQRISHLTTSQQRSDEPEMMTRYSTLHRLLRITAWCRRWLKPANARGLTLTVEELEEAERLWIRTSQTWGFPEERAALARGKDLPRRSSLLKLSPFIDDQGILRLGGRLRHAALAYEEKHPAILPGESRLTRLFVEDRHRRTLHGGVQSTLGLLRQQLWIPQGRTRVKEVIHRCVTCIRWRAVTSQPLMGDLPRPRVTPSRPFQHTGVDYAGPILLRATKGRGHKSSKAFIAVFVCMSTKAVYLDVASDYTAEAFLAALRRFTARRGLCEVIYSDCGTNFVGADRQLRELFTISSEEGRHIANELARDRIQWRFNPPAAPHFGGLWEAAVKGLKRHLRRVIGDATLTFEEMSTLLAQIEACLNSRPLVALSEDPDDLTALTPGHFLVGSAINAVPEPSLLTTPENRLTRWQLVQRMRHLFWNRWSREYLHSLNHRPKWWKSDTAVKVGRLCVILNETSPPNKWPLARVTGAHPGDDGQVRVVTVRTASSTFTRPVNRLVLLPVSDDHETGDRD